MSNRRGLYAATPNGGSTHNRQLRKDYHKRSMAKHDDLTISIENCAIGESARERDTAWLLRQEARHAMPRRETSQKRLESQYTKTENRVQIFQPCNSAIYFCPLVSRSEAIPSIYSCFHFSLVCRVAHSSSRFRPRIFSHSYRAGFPTFFIDAIIFIKTFA